MVNKTYAQFLLDIYNINPYHHQDIITFSDIKLDDEKINSIYEIIKLVHSSYLKIKGITLPNLKRAGKYTQNGLSLVLLFAYPNKKISINDISNWVALITGKHAGTLQIRHLSAQMGWNILNKNEICENIINNSDTHILLDFTRVKKGFSIKKRSIEINNNEFEIIKQQYGYCCATCRQKEGDFYINNPNKKVKLEKGHRNPILPLNIDNIIPHCEDCNKVYKDNFCFDKNGVPISLGNDKLFMKSSNEIKTKCIEGLLNDPNELYNILSKLSKEDLNKLTENCMLLI